MQVTLFPRKWLLSTFTSGCNVSEFNDSHTSDSWLGLSESFEIDGWVVKVSSQSRDIFFYKMPSVKKCQTEWPADTDQVGGDFRRQPAFFWQPCSFIVNKTATEESSYGVLSIVSNLISNAKTMSDALWVENDSSVPLLLVTSTIFKTFTPVFRSQQNCSAQKNYHMMYYPSYWFLAIKALFLT